MRTSAEPARHRQPRRSRLTLLVGLVGLVGLLAALALPFAPVLTERTTVSWPQPADAPASSTAFLVPYRPSTLTATVPCAVVRAAAVGGGGTVLATGTDGAGLLVLVDADSTRVLLNARLVAEAPLPETPSAGVGDCGARVVAGPSGATVVLAGRTVTLPEEPVPVVSRFHTALDPAAAVGLAVTVRTASPFDTAPTAVKTLLVVVQLVTVAIAIGLLTRDARAGPVFRRPRARWTRRGRRSRRARWVDVGVLGTLGVWMVVGPLSDDDGFASLIARNSTVSGYFGNYYRWWNAPETPFVLSQWVLAPLTEVSLAPLWLRMPSTLLGIGTWLLLSRGVLAAALPGLARRAEHRLLAAVFFLAAWLPFNLGARPEPYVAFGVTAVLALLWRARGPGPLGAAALVAGLTATASPAGLLVIAPMLVFARRIARIVRGGGGPGGATARVLLLGCVGAVALSVVFADQTWGGLVTATRWHTDFGPSLAWSEEPARYRYLFGEGSSGSATKRVPVLLTLALLPVVGILLARRRAVSGRLGTAGARLAGTVTIGLALLWLTPSKWSHHFGALAGLFAAFLTVAVVLLISWSRRAAPERDRALPGVGLAGAGLVAAAAGLVFTGPNAWWQPVVYAVPWADGPIRPAGLPLDSPLLWVAAAALGHLLARRRRRFAVRAPGLLAVAVAVLSVAVLLGSFLSAPLRRPTGSLAVANLEWLRGEPDCGLADDVQVLPDVPGGVLVPAATADGERIDGFAVGAGYDYGAAPPDPPGSGSSALLWGSRVTGPRDTGSLVSPWFVLPPVGPDREVAVTVAGRTGDGNALTLEFGRAGPSGSVTALVERAPPDPVPRTPGTEPRYELWRTVGVGPEAIPAGADRIRVRAVDATADPDGWLAVTGPRLRQVIGLNEYLARQRPVLVSWPLAILFPCVTDPVTVHDGFAEAPASILEAPRQYAELSAVATDPASGGVFAPLRELGELGGLGKVSTRLAGHPYLDWGALLVPDYPGARDAYRVTTRTASRPADGAPPGSPVSLPPRRAPR